MPDHLGVRLCSVALAAALLCPVCAQIQVEYIGGTSGLLRAGSGGQLELTDQRYFAFYAHDKHDKQLRVPYARMNLIEYGQQVDRRLALALVVSPVFLLSKARKHYLTVGFTDDAGEQQAIVFRVDKSSIRAALVALEARSGLKVRYQDQEARKAGN
jgi:hypothetical protein